MSDFLAYCGIAECSHFGQWTRKHRTSHASYRRWNWKQIMSSNARTELRAAETARGVEDR
jgi:phosphohistidine phosphatase SixA